jgi:predicted DNA-binding transcriptional regulator AlpA
MRKRYFTHDEGQMTITINIKDLINLTAFAKLCGMSRRHVYNLISNGEAPKHEVMSDNRIYFHKAEADEFALIWKKRHAPA